MGKHVFLIDNEISRIAQIECLIAGTQITFSTAHNERAASPMLYSEEIDLVAMSGSVSGSAPLLNKLLDLKNAKGTLLLLYPILNREARTEFYRRGPGGVCSRNFSYAAAPGHKDGLPRCSKR